MNRLFARSASVARPLLRQPRLVGGSGAARLAAPRAAGRPAQGVRNMSADAAPQEYEGLEATVRGVFPHNHQIVLAILGGYAGLFILSKVFGSSAPEEEEEEKATPAVAASSGGAASSIPSVFSDKFEEWVKAPGNAEKWEADLPEWEKKMESPEFAAQWEKSVE